MTFESWIAYDITVFHFPLLLCCDIQVVLSFFLKYLSISICSICIMYLVCVL